MTLDLAIDADPFTLSPIPPSPTGPIELQITCRTARGPGPRTVHPLVIDTDWSVTTPHDLALERVATAMGGYLSCLELVDQGIPALREVIQRRARRSPVRISRDIGGRWTPAVLPAGCSCGPFGFGEAREAAVHVRSTQHVAAEFGVKTRTLERLMGPILDAYDTLFFAPPPSDPRATALVRDARSTELLWDCGVHPESIVTIHQAVWPGGPPLPVWFYLGVVSRRPALAWVARTLATVPDEDIAVWLAWTNAELDHVHPDARTGWLQAGVPRKAIAALADGSYTPIEVALLSRATHRSLAAAALTLAAWHHARCHPKPEDITLLDELGVDPWYEPSTGAVDWLQERARGRGAPTRTQLGLLLAVAGTRAGAMKALGQGITDLRDAADLLGLTAPPPVHSDTDSTERRFASQ